MRHRGGRAAAAVLLVVGSTGAFLALLEGAAWLAGSEPLARDPGYQAVVRMRDCLFGWGHERDFCAPARVATPRPHVVVTLGGSSVQGYPLGKVTPFAKRLETRLEVAHPGEYAVFNRGLMCKDSTFVRRCAERLLDARPDVLVVYSGHNSYANWGFEAPRRRIFLEDHGWLYDVERQLLRSRFLSAFSRAIGAVPGDPVLGQRVPAPEAFREARKVILERVSADLSEVLDLAERAGAHVLLVTLVSNLHEHPVERHSWDDPPRSDGAWLAPYRRGIEAQRARRFEEALAAFKEARDLNPFGRAPSELNERLRELAAGRPHVRLVDFERVLDRLGAEEGIGCNFFGQDGWCDQFHPNDRTHQLLADALFEAVEALRGEGARAGAGS